MSLDAELCGDKRIKGLARKLVRRIDGEGPLPSEIEVPATPEEWEVIAEVGRILGVAAYQKGRKAMFRIPPERRDPAGWESVASEPAHGVGDRQSPLCRLWPTARLQGALGT